LIRPNQGPLLITQGVTRYYLTSWPFHSIAYEVFTMPTDRGDDSEFYPESLFESLQKMIDELQPDSLEEMNLLAGSTFEDYNNLPQADLQGMSPNQVFELTRNGWIRDALVLNEQVTLLDLASSELFRNARHTLISIQEMGVAKATATGAFNRKFATQMFSGFVIDEVRRESLTRLNKVFNQNDVPYLTLFRYLLPTAGLLSYRKGEFRVTKRGQVLTKESAAGELHALLFRTFFDKISLAAMDHLPEAPHVQHSVGFTLFQVGKWSDEWHDIEGLPEKLFLPAVLGSLPDLPWREDSGASFLEARVLRHLEDLGLLELEKTGKWGSLKRVRKTALFDMLIRFNL
jgi:hypothetical protein